MQSNIVKNVNKQGNYTYGRIKRSSYLLVFYQNITGGYFKYSSDAKSSNYPLRYSILNEISDIHRDSDHKFTFALVYDEHNTYNIWQQSNNPLYEQIDTTKHGHYNVTGYNPIDIPGFTSYSQCTWGGLLISSNPSGALIDGCPGGGDWVYAIGYTGIFWNDNGRYNSTFNRIPSNQLPGTVAVSLWVKVKIQTEFMEFHNNILFNFFDFVFICIDYLS